MTLTSPATTATAVCRIDQLVPERGAAALVDGHQIALFRLADGSVHALDQRDPATGANVLARGLLGTAGDEWYVASPLLKHRYSLTSGRCASDDSLAVAVHEVSIHDDVIHVTVRSGSNA